MPRSVLDEPRFRDEKAAYAYVESIDWPDGRVCPHCGVIGKSGALNGASTRIGTYKCYACRKPFTVKVGTIFEKSHIPIHIWLQAMHLMCSSKKGFSANQFCRVLGLDFKSGWFLGHRIREAMADVGVTGPLGGAGVFIEADSTYVGGKEANKHLSKRNSKNIGGMGKQIVHTLVERGGRARSHHIADVNGRTLAPLLLRHTDRRSALMTDTHGGYSQVGKSFARHETVDHGRDEYVRGDAYSNTAESYFALLKRGIYGCYFHVSQAHLHRYLAEFDFRHSNRAALGVSDEARTEQAIRGIVGKRLTYRSAGRQTGEANPA